MNMANILYWIVNMNMKMTVDEVVKDCEYLKFNNRIWLHYYNGLPANVYKALEFKLMIFLSLQKLKVQIICIWMVFV